MKLKERIETNNLGGNGLGGWVAEDKTNLTPVGSFALFVVPGSDEVNLGYSLDYPNLVFKNSNPYHYWVFGF